MIQISISNSLSQIENINKSTAEEIDRLFRYKDPNVEFAINSKLKRISEINNLLNNDRYSLDNEWKLKKEKTQLSHIVRGLERNLFKKLFDGTSFPTGLLPKLLKLLDNNKLKYEINDLRKKPKMKQIKYVLKNSLPQLRYYQKEAAKELLERHRGIVVKPTGAGKTIVLCKILWDLGLKSLIITPNKNITDMMMDTFIHFFGKSKVSKLNTKTSKLKKPINIVNIQALIKINPNLFKDIDAVFIDEFHRSAAETYQQVNSNHLKNIYFRIGCTATPFRNDGSDIAMEAVLSSVLYKYPIQKAFADGFLVEPEFRIIENKGISGNSYQSEYKNGIVNNKDRNILIKDVANDHKNDSVLILVQQVEHGEILKKLLPNSEFLHGQTKDKDRKKIMDNYRNGKLKCLIGTSVIGEGVDLPIAKVLIMAGGGKAKSQIMQNIGRVLRLFPNKNCAIIYDFTDDGTNWLSKHSKLREEIYNEY